jgi:outer membrane lipoprotein-sorting protein
MRVQRCDRLRTAVFPVFAAFLILAAALTSDAARRDLFDDLYHRGQTQNASLRTFTAAFTETTSSALLTRPLTAHGTVAVERPSRIALRYTEPEGRVLIIDRDRMTISWPSRGVRQTRDIGAAQQRVQKYFVDSSPGELRSHFEIAAREEPDRSGYTVTLTPKRKQIKEGLSRLELWLDPASLLMTSMKMTFPNGDTKVMTFTDIKPNAVIDPAVFR